MAEQSLFEELLEDPEFADSFRIMQQRRAAFAALGGSAPHMKPIPRRRPDCVMSEAEYAFALVKVERLFDEPDFVITPEFERLTAKIRHYEEKAPEFADFNKRLVELPSDVALLGVLLSQYQLSHDELPEVGDADAVTRVINQEVKLTDEQINALAARFDIDPGLFRD
ncbi:hypothetical protein EAN04_24520 [Salmonella enterica]|nr:hypothetical protein [Salmonella enterica]